MKAGIHPQFYTNTTVLCEGVEVLVTGSTLQSIRVDVYSGNHPFYTGKQKLVDIEKRADKFDVKMKSKESNAAVIAEKKKKLESRRNKTVSVSATPRLTLKDMLKQYAN